MRHSTGYIQRTLLGEGWASDPQVGCNHARNGIEGLAAPSAGDPPVHQRQPTHEGGRRGPGPFVSLPVAAALHRAAAGQFKGFNQRNGVKMELAASSAGALTGPSALAHARGGPAGTWSVRVSAGSRSPVSSCGRPTKGIQGMRQGGHGPSHQWAWPPPASQCSWPKSTRPMARAPITKLTMMFSLRAAAWAILKARGSASAAPICT